MKVPHMLFETKTFSKCYNHNREFQLQTAADVAKRRSGTSAGKTLT